MDARKKSFMLLPEFCYLPGQEIALGRVLPLDTDTEVPDPSEPLSVCTTVAEDRTTTQRLQPFEFGGDITATTAGGVNADVSLLTGVGGGIKGVHGKLTSLQISSELVVRTRFKPTQEEIASLLSNSLISNILNLRSRPPLYLITGLMVARGAKIQDKTGRHRGRGTHANADLTSLQVPLSLGINAERTNITSEGSTTTIEGEFILAYQLVRMRKKLFGKLQHKVERKWALFDDAGPKEASLSLDDYDLEYVGVDEEESAFEPSESGT